MPTLDPRVDACIAQSAEFAQPVLAQLRATVHAACPAVEETIKWGMPFFVYRGRILAFMAAFKAHCGFGFWKGEQVTGVPRAADGMGQFGKLTSVKALPPRRELTKMIKAAMKLIDAESAPVPAQRPDRRRMDRKAQAS